MNLYDEIAIDNSSCTLKLSDDVKHENIVYTDFWYVASGLELGSLSEQVLNIPLILNTAPAIWAADLVVSVPVMDMRLYEALGTLKAVFKKMYPRLSWSGTLSPKALVQSEIDIKTGRSAILFSGGLDSVFSTIRHLQNTPALLTIRGSDIPLNDQVGWTAVRQQSREFAERHRLDYFFVESNFFNYLNVEYLNSLSSDIPDWFSGVQHGMAFAGLAAPLVAARNISNVYIAASHNQSFSKPWGSLPEVDNQIAYMNTRFIHDGYEYTRQGKMRFVVDKVNRSELTLPLLRVCYSKIWLHRNRSEYNAGENCCICEKCTRTISALLVEGADPHQFGFNICTPEFIRNTDIAFARYKFRFGDNEIFMWADIQKSIRPQQMYQEMGFATRTLEFIEWLRNHDFEAYAERAEKRYLQKISRRKRIVDVIKMVPGLHGYLRAMKMITKGNR